MLTVMVIGAGLVGPAVPAASAAQPAAAARLQPLLAQLAAQSPQGDLAVIVQTSGRPDAVAPRVAQLGGRVTDVWHIINAFAAVVPARSLGALAQTDGVRWVSSDAPVATASCSQCIDTSHLVSAYDSAIDVLKVWNKSPYRQGQGIGVAVVDSGINPNGDLYSNSGSNRVLGNVTFNTDYNHNATDGYGHGTYVASIIGGDGSDGNGQYIGVAPKVNVVNVKVSNDDGSAQTASVVSGLQWVLDHKAQYNIRVVNLSLNSTAADSYRTSPLDAAVEILWFNGIVVVVSAGNAGGGAIYPPANDPFVITVGAVDDKGTASRSDDALTSFSAYGTTADGFAKPDLVAPGKNIVGRLVNMNMGMSGAHPANIVPGNNYFRMSGTSVAAPMVSGAVALLLQDEPGLNPDQVKYRLMATANQSWGGYAADQAGAGYLDVYAAVTGSTTQAANTGVTASQLLWSGSDPVNWNSVNWNSVNWNSVNWNSVNWNSVNWNSVNWNSDYWGK